MRYLQLVHNVWDPALRTSRAKVLHSFGREDELDRAAIERLIVSLRRMLDPAAAPAPSAAGPAVDGGPGAGLSFVSSHALGATWALDGVWHALGLDGLLRRLLADTRRSERVERVLFGLVAARVIEPASKLATAAWLSRRTHITGLTDNPPADVDDGDQQRPVVGDDECYRAMDWLIEAAGRVEREVFWSLATLLDLQVDLLFFDTTSTYFCTEDGDAPVTRDRCGHPIADPGERATTTDEQGNAEQAAAQGAADQDGGRAGRAGFRTWGKSKDYRGDLPQIVIGMAVTRAGIPVRVWSWPGNTTDTALIRQAKADLREWTLARVVWVGDRGFTSAANRRELRAGGHGYILGEKLRSGSADAHAALARPGRYRTVADNLQVKEVKIREDEGVHRLLQPRGRRARRRSSPGDGRQAGRADRRLRRPDRAQTGRARRAAVHHARAAPLPTHHHGRAAPGGQGGSRRRGPPGRQVPAALLRPGDERRGHRLGLQAVAPGRTRLAGPEDPSRAAPGLPPP